MASKQRPPLTPADAEYLGLATIVGADAAPVEARHVLRWVSQSRGAREHFSSCDERGGDLRCTCEWATHHGACKHTLATIPTLGHFGVTFTPPPADPGPRNPPPGNAIQSILDLEELSDEEARALGFPYWTPAAERPPTDRGGAALDRAQADVDGEHEDWGTVELSPEQPGGFWAATAYGPMHVAGDPHMSDETLGALREMAELAARQQLDPPPGDTATDDWVLGGKLAPPPWLVDPGERRRRHDEALRDLYGG